MNIEIKDSELPLEANMDKRHFKETFKEFNFGHTITIHKGDVFYVGCIDTYRVTKFFADFDDCLNATREVLENIPDWLENKIV